jgi:prepilin-type N-terminal cleavage/methylation domain-containing protein
MPTPRRKDARAGFTLIELAIALVLFSLVAGTIIRVISRQQKFYQGASDLMDARSQLRQAGSVLPTDIRGLSSVDGDITALSDSALEFRGNIGSSIVCAKPSANQVDIPPRNLTKHTLTAWLTQPQPGDTAYIFDEGPTEGAQDDVWRGYAITAIANNTATCAGRPVTDTTTDDPVTKPRWRLTLATNVPATSVVGAGVRFTRHVRYSLYQAGDNQWYLGYKDYRNGAWSTIQPLSGPYLAYNATASQSGLAFQYFDSLNNRITALPSANPVARVDFTLHGQGGVANNSATSTNSRFTDSLIARVAIRNRS